MLQLKKFRVLWALIMAILARYHNRYDEKHDFKPLFLGLTLPAAYLKSSLLQGP